MKKIIVLSILLFVTFSSIQAQKIRWKGSIVVGSVIGSYRLTEKEQNTRKEVLYTLVGINLLHIAPQYFLNDKFAIGVRMQTFLGFGAQPVYSAYEESDKDKDIKNSHAFLLTSFLVTGDYYLDNIFDKLSTLRPCVGLGVGYYNNYVLDSDPYDKDNNRIDAKGGSYSSLGIRPHVSIELHKRWSFYLSYNHAFDKETANYINIGAEIILGKKNS